MGEWKCSGNFWRQNFILTSLLLFQGVSIALGVTCVFGPHIYRTLWFGYPVARYFEFATYISAVLTSHPVIIKNIYLSYKSKTGKMRPFSDATRPMIPLVGLFALSSLWVFMSQNHIAWAQPRVLFMCFGTVFSNFSVSLRSFHFDLCCFLIKGASHSVHSVD